MAMLYIYKRMSGSLTRPLKIEAIYSNIKAQAVVNYKSVEQINFEKDSFYIF